MKTLLTSVALVLLTAGCTATAGKTSSSHPDPRPGGTEVGTSFPGVNQGTTDTTATRSNDTY